MVSEGEDGIVFYMGWHLAQAIIILILDEPKERLYLWNSICYISLIATSCV